MSLSDDWQRRIDKAQKKGASSVYTKKGTAVTQGTVDAIRGDESGLIVIADNTERIIAEMDSAIARALEAIGIQAEGDAKKMCPVDTGRLRNSITHTIDSGDNTAIVGTNVEYALFVHNGTSRSKAQPFLVDAVESHKGNYAKIAKAMLEGK